MISDPYDIGGGGTNDPQEQISLPELRTFVVLRYVPVDDTIEKVFVLAHSVQFADGILCFQSMEIDPKFGPLTRTVRGFREWIDFDIVPLTPGSKLSN